MTNFYLFTKESEKESNSSFSKFASILDKRSQEVVKKKKVTKPYQFFGIWIAQNLDDFDNVALYIRLAKFQDQNLLTQAVSYIKDYPNAQSKHKLFMWYLKGKLKKVEKKIRIKTKKKKENILF